jgi:acyl-CoA thioester hydrolase
MSAPSGRSDFAFFHPLRVRWNECDMQGIVFNVNYPLYFDIGIWEYTRALGYSLGNAPEFVTARLECDFRGSAKFDDALEIGVRTARLGRKSCAVAFAAFRGEELLAEGRNTYVAVRRGTRETRPLEEDYVARVLAFEKTAPDAAQP